MGQVIRFSDHQVSARRKHNRWQDSLVPVELALGVPDEDRCLATIARHGLCAVHPRVLSDGSEAVIYLITISDAIFLNKRILEVDQMDDERVGRCIDLIQMLENINDSLPENTWESISSKQNLHS
ncbi:MAG: hypothetical protein JKY98_03440 [Gammaproteobacteria bacterium]|nr:hypothetical protein [Gammaproteobacteria bacterium]